ncbi:MAG: putative DNA binding domain-containing protein [Prevotella sp.]|nr:putative DNA binding domain-containing protein [Prevotella sp.]
MAKIAFEEKQNIEYKESWRDEYLKWICGFANAQGGRIYIGVDDNHEIVGISDSKRLMEDIPNKIVTTLGIVAEVNLHEADGLDYIEIVVSPSNVPIAFKGQYHYRSGSTKQELKGVALQQFLLKKMGLSWDDMPVPYATIDDIDRSAIDYFLRRSIASERMDEEEQNASTEDVLRNLDLLTPEGELKSAAILLFGKRVHKFFPAAEFKIGRFHNDESDLIIQDVVDCNLIQMAGKVMDLLRSRYLVSPIRYEGMQRIEELEIPQKALRELIYNSIVHKQYSGPAILMRVFDKSVELWNYGLLPEELTPADLMKKHASYPRNRNIASVFYKAGFIESWGRGYKKIREEFEKAGHPVPTVEESGGGVLVTIQRKTVEEFIAGREECDGVNGGLNVGKNVGINIDLNSCESDDIKNCSKTDVGVNVGVNDKSGGLNNEGVGVNVGVNNIKAMNFSRRQIIIKEIINQNPMITAKQMSEALSVTQRTIERDLSVLQKAKVIRHEGSDKSGIWVVLEPYNSKE